MATWKYIVLCALLVAAPSQAADSKVALTYVFHCESEWAEVWDDQAAYLDYRGKLSVLVEGLVGAGAAIDIQVCAEALLADQRWADGRLYLDLYNAAPEQVAIDAHGHDGAGNACNTADAAWLLKQAGLPDTGVVGGYRLDDPPGVTLCGAAYPYEWHPTILWGGATLEHLADPVDSGLRREVDQIHIGGNIGLEGALALALANPGELFTCALFIGVDMLPPGGVEQILAKMPEAGGAVYWATLPQVVVDWLALYDGRASYRRLEGEND